jgi:hypothetical protein
MQNILPNNRQIKPVISLPAYMYRMQPKKFHPHVRQF